MMALEGIKILDLSRMAPGPYCTMILGDLGADVILIEEPPKPWTGGMGRYEKDNIASLKTLRRNKKSIVLNLKLEQAREIFLRLAERSDVVLEGYRPGVVKRLGVDYETVKKKNPRIVYCSLSGYGQDGPYRSLVGHDINYISMAGALGIIGPANGPPSIPLNVLADFAAGGMQSTIGILVALLAREKTGEGQYVDISLTDGVLSLIEGMAAIYLINGSIPGREKQLINGGAPFYNVYQTKDGKYLSIGCIEPWFFENLCRVLKREDLIPWQGAEEKEEELQAIFRGIFLTKTRDEWFDLLSQTDICVGKVYSMDEVFRDPQILHRQMLVEVDDPDLGKVRQVGISVKLSQTPGRVRSGEPRLGQHTDALLLDLGYSAEDIKELRQAGAVQ